MMGWRIGYLAIPKQSTGRKGQGSLRDQLVKAQVPRTLSSVPALPCLATCIARLAAQQVSVCVWLRAGAGADRAGACGAVAVTMPCCAGHHSHLPPRLEPAHGPGGPAGGQRLGG